MLELTDVCKNYTAGRAALSYVNMQIGDNEIIALLGGEGAGKTSLLKVIGGATERTSGKIFLDGRPLVLKDVIMVFDELALREKQTVKKNLERSLRLRKMSDGEIADRISATAEYFGLLPVLNQKVRYITEFEKRKTALARLALRDDYSIVLVDDILKGLSAEERRALWKLEMSILCNLGKTVLFATTEFSEACAIADRIAVFDNCQIKQFDEATQLIERPTCLSVAKLANDRFNAVTAKLAKADDLAVEIGKAKARLSIEFMADCLCSPDYIGGEVLLGFDARDVVSFDGGLEADVIYAEKTRDGNFLHCQSQDGELQLLSDDVPKDGVFRFLPRADRLHLFDPLTENSLLK